MSFKRAPCRCRCRRARTSPPQGTQIRLSGSINREKLPSTTEEGCIFAPWTVPCLGCGGQVDIDLKGRSGMLHHLTPGMGEDSSGTPQRRGGIRKTVQGTSRNPSPKWESGKWGWTLVGLWFDSGWGRLTQVFRLGLSSSMSGASVLLLLDARSEHLFRVPATGREGLEAPALFLSSDDKTSKTTGRRLGAERHFR